MIVAQIKPSTLANLLRWRVHHNYRAAIVVQVQRGGVKETQIDL